jgi:hypothetical protein
LDELPIGEFGIVAIGNANSTHSSAIVAIGPQIGAARNTALALPASTVAVIGGSAPSSLRTEILCQRRAAALDGRRQPL